MMNRSAVPRRRPRRGAVVLVAWIAALAGFGAGQVAAEEMTYHYDDAGRLIGVNDGKGGSISYLYDAGGNILKRLVSQIVDTDNDFMDDEFERTHFTNLDRDGKGDFDKDGFSDLEEFLAGTLPKDNTSLLKVSSIGNDGGGFRISWKSTSGKIYRVQFADDLAAPVWNDLPGDVMAKSEASSKMDETGKEAGRRFYRVVVL